MKFRMLLGALFKLRNLAALAIASGAAYFVNSAVTASLPWYNVPEIGGLSAAGQLAAAGAVAVYLVFVGQTLLSKSFHTEFNHKEKIRHIQDLNYACLKLANDAKRHTNPTYLQKLRKVMEDKNDVVNSFFRGERSFIKEKIVEQTLSLVLAYIKLLTNFCIRSRELNGTDVGEITNRINVNMRKLNFSSDHSVAADIKNLIEMDEKILNRLKEEKLELERISAKLDYMESTVSAFKHTILSNIEQEETLEKLETAVNEATALENVLEDRRKNRLRI